MRGLYRSLRKLTLLLVFASLATSLVVKAADRTYGASSKAFTLQLPSKWALKSDVDGYAQFDGPDKTFLWVYRHSISPMTPEKIMAFYTDKGYKLLYTRKATKMSGLPAGRFILAKTDAETEWRYDVTDFYSNGIQWVIFAVAPRMSFKQHEATFKQMYSSFKLLGTKVSPSTAGASASATAATQQTKPTSGTKPAPAIVTPQSTKPTATGATSQGTSTKPNTGSASAVSSAGTGSSTGVGVSIAAPSSSGQPTKVAGEQPPVESIRPAMIAFARLGKVWIRELGKATDVHVGTGSLPVLSRDGSTLVYKVDDSRWMVYKVDAAQQTELKLDGKVDWLAISGDGKRVAYTVVRRYLIGSPTTRSYVLSLEAKDAKPEELKGYTLRVSGTGSIGQEVNKVEWWAYPQFTGEPNKLVMTARAFGQASIVEVDMEKKEAKLIAPGGEKPLVSPGGEQILYTKKIADVDELWIAYTDGRLHERLLGVSAINSYAWMPDGDSIIIERGGSLENYSLETNKTVEYIKEGLSPTTSVATLKK